MSGSSVTVESLELEVQTSSQSAVSGLEALASSLKKIRAAAKGGIGLTPVVNQLTKLNTALNGVNGDNAQKLDKLASSLSKLQGLGNIKISTSVGKQLENIGNATNSISSTVLLRLNKLSQAVSSLSGIGNASGLKSTITQLHKMPELAETLDKVDMAAFTRQTQQLSTALAPLANQLNTVSASFSRMPSNIRQTVQATNTISPANNTAKKSYAELAAKIGTAYITLKKAANTISSWTKSSMNYVEDLNLFTASMGEYASKAKYFAENVGELMGIDPADWMRNQGYFNNMVDGFGVASDKAALMSQNLTQLGYDIASYFNLSVNDSMTKLQSGLAGEPEALRRLGYDLSVARLQQEAYALGIEKSVSAMSQAEKAELRYYAIMTQVTTAQGDMARTLEAPANQLRILQAQVTQAGRALGNIFIPAITKALPYFIAFFEVTRSVADIISNLLGFELPEIDYSGLASASGSASELSEGLEEADKEAKKVKRTLMGFDELNILSSTDNGDSDLDEILGGGLGIDLPTYDFIGDAVSSKVKDIVGKMKEWLGITDEIHSWSELLDTRFGSILKVVGLIGAGLALWKIGSFVKSLSTAISGFTKMGGAGKKAFGLIAGAAEFITVKDAVKNLVSGTGDVTENIIAIVGAAGVASAAMVAAFGPAGLAVAAVVGLTAVVVGLGEAERDYWKEVREAVYWNGIEGTAIEDVQKALDNYFDAFDFDKQAEWIEKVKLSEEAYGDARGAFEDLWHSISDKPEFDTTDIDNLRESFEQLTEAAIALNETKIDSLMETIRVGIETNITPELTERLEGLNSKLSASLALINSDISSISLEVQSLLNEIAANGGRATEEQKQRLQEAYEEINKRTLSDDYSAKTWDRQNAEALFVRGEKINAGTSYEEVLANVEKLAAQRDSYLETLGLKRDQDYNTLEQLIRMDEEVYGGSLGFSWDDLALVDANYQAMINEVNKKFDTTLENIFDTYTEGMLDYDNYHGDWLMDAFSDYSLWGYILPIFGNENVAQYEANRDISEAQKEIRELMEEEIKGRKIKTYASGGYPNNGSLFIANEAGPELVGTLGGRTAVANNSQIEEALYRAVAQGMADGMAGSGNNGDGEIHVYVELDGDIIAETVARKNEIRTRRFNGR